MRVPDEHVDRALAFAHELAFPRYPGTPGDERAIALVAERLRESGLDVTLEEFSYDVRPAFRALRAVLLTAAFSCAAAAAGVAACRLPPAAGLAVLLIGLAGGGVVLVWAPGSERIYAREGPTRTANVMARRPATGRGKAAEPRLTLAFVAHHDSKSQNLTFPVRMSMTLLSIAGALLLGGTLAALTLGGQTPPQLLWSGAVAAAALLVLSTLRSGNASPGGVDNAGSVGLVTELARLLPPRIADDVELVFLSPGAEEDHMVGAMRWLDAHGDTPKPGQLDPERFYGFNFDGVGNPGRLVLLSRFGIYGFARPFARRLTPLVHATARDLGLKVRDITMPPAMGIDSMPFAHRGYECLSISSGSLGRATFAVHSAGDTADLLDRETLAHGLELAVAAAERAARDL